MEKERKGKSERDEGKKLYNEKKCACQIRKEKQERKVQGKVLYKARLIRYEEKNVERGFMNL